MDQINTKRACITESPLTECKCNKPVINISSTDKKDISTVKLESITNNTINKNFNLYYLEETGTPELNIIKAKYLRIQDAQYTETNINDSDAEKSLSYIIVPILQFSDTKIEHNITQRNSDNAEQNINKLKKSPNGIVEDIVQNNADNNLGIPQNRILHNHVVQARSCPCGLTFSIRILPKIARIGQNKCFSANFQNKDTVVKSLKNDSLEAKFQKEKVIFASKEFSNELNQDTNNNLQTQMERITSKSVQTKRNVKNRSIGIQKHLNKSNCDFRRLIEPFNIFKKTDAKKSIRKHQNEANVGTGHSVLPNQSDNINTGINLRVIEPNMNNTRKKIKSFDIRNEPKQNLLTLRSVKSEVNENKHFIGDDYKNYTEKKNHPSARIKHKTKSFQSRNRRYDFIPCECVRSDINLKFPKHQTSTLEDSQYLPFHKHYTKEQSGDWIDITDSIKSTDNALRRNKTNNQRNKKYHNKENTKDRSDIVKLIRRNDSRSKHLFDKNQIKMFSSGKNGQNISYEKFHNKGFDINNRINPKYTEENTVDSDKNRNKHYDDHEHKKMLDIKDESRDWLANSRSKERQLRDRNINYGNKYAEKETDDVLSKPKGLLKRDHLKNKNFNNFNDRKKLNDPQNQSNTRYKNNDNNKRNKIIHAKEDSDNWLNSSESLRKLDHNQNHENSFNNRDNSRNWLQNIGLKKRKGNTGNKGYENDKHNKIKYTEQDTGDRLNDSEPVRSRKRPQNQSPNTFENTFEVKEDSRNWLENIGLKKRKRKVRNKSYGKLKKSRYTEEDTNNWSNHSEPLHIRDHPRNINHSDNVENTFDTEEDSRNWSQNVGLRKTKGNPQREGYGNNKRKKIDRIEEDTDDWLNDTDPTTSRDHLRNITHNGNNLESTFNTKGDSRNWLQNIGLRKKKSNPRRKGYGYNKRKKINHIEEDTDDWLNNMDPTTRRDHLRNITHNGNNLESTFNTKRDSRNWLQNIGLIKRKGKARHKGYSNNKRKKGKYIEQDSDDWLYDSEPLREKDHRQNKRSNSNNIETKFDTKEGSSKWLQNVGLKKRKVKAQHKLYGKNRRKKVNYIKQDSDDWLNDSEPLRERNHHQNKVPNGNNLENTFDAKEGSRNWLQNIGFKKRKGIVRRKDYGNNKGNKITHIEEDSDNWLEDTEQPRRHGIPRSRNNNLKKHKKPYDTSEDLEDIKLVKEKRMSQDKRYGNNKRKKMKYFEENSDWTETNKSSKEKYDRNKRKYNSNRHKKKNIEQESHDSFQSTKSVRRKGRIRKDKWKKILRLPFQNYTDVSINKYFKEQPISQGNKLRKVKPKSSNYCKCAYNGNHNSNFAKEHKRLQNTICKCQMNKRYFYHYLYDCAVFSTRVMKNGLIYAYNKFMDSPYIRRKRCKKRNEYSDYEKVLIKSFKSSKYLDFKYISEQLKRITIILCACALWCPVLVALELCRRWIF